MSVLRTVFITLVILVNAFSALAIDMPADSCASLKNCRLRYFSDNDEVFVSIKDSSFTELHQKGKYTIEARIDWLEDCYYKVTIRKVTLPSFPLGTGDEVWVRIRRIEGKIIHYTITAKSVSWDGSFEKIE